MTKVATIARACKGGTCQRDGHRMTRKDKKEWIAKMRKCELVDIDLAFARNRFRETNLLAS